MKRITERQKRSRLNEGRTFGIGFAILAPKKKLGTFKTLNAFTTCRDYLNDFIYVEGTGTEIGSIYGYSHKKLDCFKRKRQLLLGVKALDYNKNGGKWGPLEDCSKLLVDNHKNLEKFLNNLEDEIGIPKSKIFVDEETLIIKSSMYWTKSTPLISAFTLFIRNFFNVTEEKLKQDFKVLLSNHKPFIPADEFMMKPLVDFYDELKSGECNFSKVNYEDLGIKGSSKVHNFGIQGFIDLVRKNKTKQAV